MEIEVSMGNDSITFNLDNPFKVNARELAEQIRARFQNEGINGADIEGLIPRMIKGVYGCEEGCPADAKRLVSQGYGDFHIEYIEGGILAAYYRLSDGGTLSIKVFPEF